MKVSPFAVVLAKLLAIPSLALTDNPQSCIDPATIDDDTDLFPVKTNIKYSKKWSISYHKTYKILTDTDTGESYLLYQCGTTPPEDEVDKHSQIFSIPLDSIVPSSTQEISYLEQLGKR